MIRRRTPESPSRRHLALSASVHVAAIALAWTTTILRPEPLEYITYEIELVSPPPAPAEEPVAEDPVPEEELVVERPDPEPEPVADETPAPPDPEATAAPEEEVREDPPPQPEPEAAAAPVESEAESEESGEDINVRMEGLRRDYPAYYNNIIRQMQRCFRWLGTGDFEAVVRFSIGRDGTVSGARLVQRSGNPEFDFEALGAVECAGRPGRLGALPEDLPGDELPIEFRISPRRGG